MAKKKQKQIELHLPEGKASRTTSSAEKVYLPLYKHNIYDYYTKGLFVPAKYIENRLYKDIQSNRPDELIVSLEPVTITGGEYINVEIWLSDIEFAALNPIKGSPLHIYPKPIPISRTLSVLVDDIDVKREIVTKSNNESSGPLLDHLVKISVFTSISEKDTYTLKVIPTEFDYSQYINNYDSKLGAIAILRNAGFYYPSGNSISTLPGEYLSLLNSLNLYKQVQNENKLVSILFNDKCIPETILEDFIGWFLRELKIDRDSFVAFIENTTFIENDLKSGIINDLIQILDSSFSNRLAQQYINPDRQVRSLVKIIAALSNNQSVDMLEALIANLNGHEHPKLGNLILLFLGAYHGYSNLRPYIWLEALGETTSFRPFLNSYRQPIKYTLEYNLDFQTIESIYNYCFNGSLQLPKVITPERDYLESKRKVKNAPKQLYVVNTQTIDDCYVLDIATRSSVDEIKKDLSKRSESITISDYLFGFCTKHQVGNLRYNSIESISIVDCYYTKSDLLNAIDGLNEHQIVELLGLLTLESSV